MRMVILLTENIIDIQMNSRLKEISLSSGFLVVRLVHMVLGIESLEYQIETMQFMKQSTMTLLDTQKQLE